MSKKVNEQILTSGLRQKLKTIMQDEISKLPELIEGLEPRERLNFICKILPFVVPKVESIDSTDGEPWQL